MTWRNTTFQRESANGDNEHRRRTKKDRHHGASGLRSYPCYGRGGEPHLRFDRPRLKARSFPQGVYSPSDSRGCNASRPRNLHGRSAEAERSVHDHPAFHCENAPSRPGELAMVEQPNPNVASEAANVQGREVDLEATDAYVKRAKADVHRSKARSANWVSLILVLGLVLSLPFYVVAIASFPSEPTPTHIERIFLKWYDVVSPLVGAVIGALFGLSFS